MQILADWVSRGVLPVRCLALPIVLGGPIDYCLHCSIQVVCYHEVHCH